MVKREQVTTINDIILARVAQSGQLIKNVGTKRCLARCERCATGKHTKVTSLSIRASVLDQWPDSLTEIILQGEEEPAVEGGGMTPPCTVMICSDL